MAEVLLTAEGRKNLEERLNYLITVKRPEAAQKIGEARGFGDLSENAEYDAAKEEQGRIEGEIAEIEAKLRVAVEIVPTDNKNCVTIGGEVKVTNLITNKVGDYFIVGTTEADPFANPPRLSNESPVGKALLGKNLGDIATVVKPNGDTFQLRIDEIK